MERIKLFSKKQSDRIKLFSNTPTLRTLICQDCGETIESAESPSSAVCPRCGGKRLNISLFKTPEIDTPEEKKLKEFSGKSLSKNEYERLFSDRNLIEKGFANVDGDTVNIDSQAYATEKLFSKLTISVTKALELDPSIMCGHPNKSSIIGGLGLPEKHIMILRKAHNIPEIEEDRDNEDGEDWISDSNIKSDLRLEYGGQSMSIDKFVEILHDQYPDAPENIIENLIDNGVLSIEGSQIHINS